ncbi:DUF6090 family protein [uncultured Croceitalea sp.]|uniref:DUF6090 family protein n=1 Tax=uncultured Croceitalea sp. TaxID=1798908 RepID=UPI0033059DE9
MIKFFRKIRQNLLSENKFSKYLLYAIGEILLVVIGILIALQINNWNLEKIDRKQEAKLLSQITADLEKNKVELTELQERLAVNKYAMDSLLVRLQDNNYTTMVPFYVAFIQRKSYFPKASSGFNMIKNGKAPLITNDSILKDVLNLYENDFNNLDLREHEMHSQIDGLQNDFVNKLFRPGNNRMNVKLEGFDEVPTELFEPLNFDNLTTNYEYINRLLQLKKTTDSRIAFIRKTDLKMDSAINHIKRELRIRHH